MFIHVEWQNEIAKFNFLKPPQHGTHQPRNNLDWNTACKFYFLNQLENFFISSYKNKLLSVNCHFVTYPNNLWGVNFLTLPRNF